MFSAWLATVRADTWNTAGSSSPEVRDAYLKDAEQLLLENSNIIPLYSRTMPYVIRDKVLGAVSDGLGGWYFGAVNRAS